MRRMNPMRCNGTPERLAMTVCGGFTRRLSRKGSPENERKPCAWAHLFPAAVIAADGSHLSGQRLYTRGSGETQPGGSSSPGWGGTSGTPAMMRANSAGLPEAARVAMSSRTRHAENCDASDGSRTL